MGGCCCSSGSGCCCSSWSCCYCCGQHCLECIFDSLWASNRSILCVLYPSNRRKTWRSSAAAVASRCLLCRLRRIIVGMVVLFVSFGFMLCVALSLLVRCDTRNVRPVREVVNWILRNTGDVHITIGNVFLHRGISGYSGINRKQFTKCLLWYE